MNIQLQYFHFSKREKYALSPYQLEAMQKAQIRREQRISDRQKKAYKAPTAKRLFKSEVLQ